MAEKTSQNLQIRLLQPDAEPRWDAFVQGRNAYAVYHLSGWQRVIENTFGHPTFYVYALQDDEIVGVLPLVYLKSRLIGKFFVSVPFVNYGGLLTELPAARAALLAEATRIARQQGAQHIEFRHLANFDLGLPVKTSKALMVLDLPDTAEALWDSFKSKLRSQIKRPEKEGFTTRFGKIEEVDNFYAVFAAKMRDLGTPVYTKRLFTNIIREFPEMVTICTVSAGDQPIAAGFLLGWHGMLQIPWAASLREYDRFSANMLLYWHILKFACEQGYQTFDFGRSTPDEGTYKFKAQWGAQPVPCYWHYWLADGSATLPEINPHNPKYEMAIKVWQRLPVPVTKLLGPAIVKYLP